MKTLTFHVFVCDVCGREMSERDGHTRAEMEFHEALPVTPCRVKAGDRVSLRDRYPQGREEDWMDGVVQSVDEIDSEGHHGARWIMFVPDRTQRFQIGKSFSIEFEKGAPIKVHEWNIHSILEEVSGEKIRREIF